MGVTCGVCVCVWVQADCQHEIKKLLMFGLQEKMAALEAQVKQLGLQASQDWERLAKDRIVTLHLLQKVSLSLVTGHEPALQ